MKGEGRVYIPGIATPTVLTFNKRPELKVLQNAVGGFIELIPNFSTIEINGKVVDCRAFCNEEGKLTDNPQLNNKATVLWDLSLRRANHRGLIGRDGHPIDVLVGSIIVITGDKEFLDNL